MPRLIYLNRFVSEGGNACLKPADERSHLLLAHLWGSTKEPWYESTDENPLFIFEADDLEPTEMLARAHGWEVVVT